MAIFDAVTSIDALASIDAVRGTSTTPSFTDNRNYSTMQNRIANEIKQTALSTNIAGLGLNTIQAAIGDAIYFYQQMRFAFQETTNSGTVTTSGVNLYTPPQDLIEIDVLEIVDTAAGLTLPLKPRTIQWILNRDVTTPLETGQPTDYAWYANQVRLYITPDAGASGNNYTLVYYYRGMIPPPVNPTDAGYWMTTGELMIRAYAKALIYDQVIKNPERADREYAISNRQYLQLLGQTDADQLTGTTAPTRF